LEVIVDSLGKTTINFLRIDPPIKSAIAGASNTSLLSNYINAIPQVFFYHKNKGQ